MQDLSFIRRHLPADLPVAILGWAGLGAIVAEAAGLRSMLRADPDISASIYPAVQNMLLAARAIERIGDNAVDIGEQVAFVVTGLFREFEDASHPGQAPLPFVGPPAAARTLPQLSLDACSDVIEVRPRGPEQRDLPFARGRRSQQS